MLHAARRCLPRLHQLTSTTGIIRGTTNSSPNVPSETFTIETSAQTFNRVADKLQGELLMKLHHGLDKDSASSVQMRGSTMIWLHKGQPLLQVDRDTQQGVLTLHAKGQKMLFAHQGDGSWISQAPLSENMTGAPAQQGKAPDAPSPPPAPLQLYEVVEKLVLDATGVHVDLEPDDSMYNMVD